MRIFSIEMLWIASVEWIKLEQMCNDSLQLQYFHVIHLHLPIAIFSLKCDKRIDWLTECKMEMKEEIKPTEWIRKKQTKEKISSIITAIYLMFFFCLASISKIAWLSSPTVTLLLRLLFLFRLLFFIWSMT